MSPGSRSGTPFQRDGELICHREALFETEFKHSPLKVDEQLAIHDVEEFVLVTVWWSLPGIRRSITAHYYRQPCLIQFCVHTVSDMDRCIVARHDLIRYADVSNHYT